MHLSTVTLLALTSAALSAQDEPCEYVFREREISLDGIEKLSELRGRPVLIEFWGVR